MGRRQRSDGAGKPRPQEYNRRRIVWTFRPRSCPVEGCPGQAGTSMAMRINFYNQHVQDIVIILEEGNLPHPRCSQCNMLVPWRALNGSHHATAMCKKGVE